MKTNRRSYAQPLALPIALALLGAGCATTTPVELSNARTAYQRASVGPAAQHTPTDLHKAKTALDRAEHSFLQEKGSKKTVDLAYIAERTAQIAEARAVTAIAAKSSAQAKQELGTTQEDMTRRAQGALASTKEQLGAAERAHAKQAQLTGEADRKAAASEERAVAADLETQKANDALAALAAKEEERGMVITLSGSVLFRSNDATLLPGAQGRLDQVASALVAKGRSVVVEGHTDSRGSQATNQNLSQRRAESVRSYLVSRGFPLEKIVAQGLGPERPVADNGSAEGRANNRRVEIVIAKAP